MQRFDEKLPAEKNILTFNMAFGLPTGVTLTGAITVSVTVQQGTDPTPSAILNGAATFDSTNTMILVPVQGGVAGVDYKIEVESGTTNTNILLGLQAILPVRDPI